MTNNNDSMSLYDIFNMLLFILIIYLMLEIMSLFIQVTP